MIDFLGIITRTWLGMHAPATAQIHTAPLVATPAAGSAVAAATSTAAPTADVVVDNVQKFYSSIKQVTSLFRQTVTNQTFGTHKDSDGTVWLSKPGKMRWDYVEKKKQDVQVSKSFISNGTTLYVVEHANKQVVKKNLSQDLMPVAVTFLYGKGDLKAEFNAAIDTSGKYGSKDDIVLKLSPKKPSAQYKSLYLVVNKTDFHVSQSVIIDSSDNTNHFRFFSPDFAKEIKADWFEFNEASVKNYRIIDADQQDKQGSSAGSPSPGMPVPLPAVPPPPPAPEPKK